MPIVSATVAPPSDPAAAAEEAAALRGELARVLAELGALESSPQRGPVAAGWEAEAEARVEVEAEARVVVEAEARVVVEAEVGWNQ